MHLMILENKRLRSTLRPEQGVVSIGSSPQCVVHLPDPRISQHQATILRGEDGAWWLEIIDAGIPTSLNRAVQKSRARLRHADEIELGQYSIRFFMDSEKTHEEIQRERMVALSKQHGETLPLGAILHRFDHPVTVSKEHLEQITLLGLKLAHVEAIREVLPPILRAMLRLVDGRRAWIGIRTNPHGPFELAMGLNDQGQPCDRPAFSQTMEVRCIAHSQYICCPNASSPNTRSAMAVPLACGSGNVGMLYVENDASDPPFDEKSLGIFSALVCCAAPPVENTLFKAAAKRQAVVSSEQTIARATQDAITPKAMPRWEELQMAAYRCMGTAKCCDFYDIVQLPDKTASIIVARLCVEGLALPRVLSEVRSTFRSASLHADAPHLFCRALNWMLHTGDGRCGVDLVNVWIHPKTGKVTACSAGDGVALRRIGANGACVNPVPSLLPAVAATRAPAYESFSLDLSPGDTLLLATNGVALANGADGQAFGLQALEESIADGVGDLPGNLLNEFQTDLTEHVAGGACPEDVTVVLARWK